MLSLHLPLSRCLFARLRCARLLDIDIDNALASPAIQSVCECALLLACIGESTHFWYDDDDVVNFMCALCVPCNKFSTSTIIIIITILCISERAGEGEYEFDRGNGHVSSRCVINNTTNCHCTFRQRERVCERGSEYGRNGNGGGGEWKIFIFEQNSGRLKKNVLHEYFWAARLIIIIYYYEFLMFAGLSGD